jgi:hypothetical protein
MSAVKGRPRMDVLVDSQHRRQRVLDFLNAHGAASVLQISAGTGDKHKLIIGTLALMRGRHEVESRGDKLAMRYVALATTTVSAQAMYDAIRDAKTRKAAENAAEVPERASVSAGGVHKCGGNPPIKNQGGQGALRRAAHVNCYQNY